VNCSVVQYLKLERL